MHSGPTHNRDSLEDWQQEVEECLRYMDEVDPTLAQYVSYLESIDTVPEAGVAGDAGSVSPSALSTFVRRTGSSPQR